MQVRIERYSKRAVAAHSVSVAPFRADREHVGHVGFLCHATARANHRHNHAHSAMNVHFAILTIAASIQVLV